jgi:UPF0716 family protein affecting phage T7 exclusion
LATLLSALTGLLGLLLAGLLVLLPALLSALAALLILLAALILLTALVLLVRHLEYSLVLHPTRRQTNGDGNVPEYFRCLDASLTH